MSALTLAPDFIVAQAIIPFSGESEAHLGLAGCAPLGPTFDRAWRGGTWIQS